MQLSEGRFPGADGIELSYRCWRPESEPRAAVALVHGVGEHCGRYMNVVVPLVEDGYAVYGYDQRGHGVSPGPRVHIDHWTQYREDLGSYLRVVANHEPDRPLVVYGHSMGSLVVLDFLLEGRSYEPAGAVISGVATEPAGVGKPYQVAAARLLTGLLPRFSVNLGIDAEALTRAPEALAAYRADPLVSGRATIRWGTESLDTVERVKGALERIDVPLLVIHGEADRLNLVHGAHTLFEKASSPDKTLRVYPGVFHEPHNDIGHEQVVDDIREWLARLPGVSA